MTRLVIDRKFVFLFVPFALYYHSVIVDQGGSNEKWKISMILWLWLMMNVIPCPRNGSFGPKRIPMALLMVLKLWLKYSLVLCFSIPGDSKADRLKNYKSASTFRLTPIADIPGYSIETFDLN